MSLPVDGFVDGDLIESLATQEQGVLQRICDGDGGGQALSLTPDALSRLVESLMC